MNNWGTGCNDEALFKCTGSIRMARKILKMSMPYDAFAKSACAPFGIIVTLANFVMMAGNKKVIEIMERIACNIDRKIERQAKQCDSPSLGA